MRLRRITTACAMLALAGSARASEPHVLAETPAGVSFECISAARCNATAQDLASLAQSYCRAFGKDARRTSLTVTPAGDTRAGFACVEQRAEQ